MHECEMASARVSHRLIIHIDHEVKATADGSEITVRTVVSGPGAEDIGPMVTADTPKALAALVELAEK